MELTRDAKDMLVRIYKAAGTWPGHPIVNLPVGKELMQKGLVELIKPNAPYLPYAALTISGERRAEELQGDS